MRIGEQIKNYRKTAGSLFLHPRLGDDRPAVFQSLCRGMGTLQRMLGTIQNSRYRSLDKSL